MAKNTEEFDFDNLEQLIEKNFDDNLAVPTEGAKTIVEKKSDKPTDVATPDFKAPDLPVTNHYEHGNKEALPIKNSTVNLPAHAPPNYDTKATNRDDKTNTEQTSRSLDTLLAIPLDISVSLGRTELSISELMLIGQGSIIELDKLVGDSLDVFVNGRPIAKGNMVLSSEVFGCKLNHILGPQERLKDLVINS